MGRNQRYFLNGLIRHLKPRKVLEVGTSAGGGTSIILNAISDIDGAKLYSVDYLEKAHRFTDKPVGFLVEEKFPQFLDKWQVFRGGDISRFIEEIGGDIDMLVLDTAHIHPWETLNFLCILPFMKHEISWTVLHDITIYVNPAGRMNALACRYLYSSVVSEEKLSPPPEDSSKIFSNIGAFRVTQDTFKYANTLFESLLIPWDVMVGKDDLKSIGRIIEKCYSPEQYEFFCNALKFQQYLREHPASFWYCLKYAFKQSHLGLASFVARIRHPYAPVPHSK